MGFIRNLGEEEQVVAAEGFGGLPVRPVSVQAAEGDVVAGARLGVVFPDGGLDGPHPDLFGRVVLGSHGVCRKKQVNPTCRASPPTWKTAGFKPLETIPLVLPWLAALNKKGGGDSEFTWLTAVADAISTTNLECMRVQELRAEIEALSVEERRRLAAFLVSLRHKDLADYRARMARKIDDDSPENWVTLEEMDHRLTI